MKTIHWVRCTKCDWGIEVENNDPHIGEAHGISVKQEDGTWILNACGPLVLEEQHIDEMNCGTASH